ncbi:hypothetical protein [Micromonospora sp. NPDC048839]|uniref:hypothetical protein n=1 Tax=Micromonospora sp. NPDC048839 TaxID=3155641 RepID=UPI0033D75036
MPASKIQNHQEAIDWITEGRTYREMIELYREKYGIETSVTMWGNFRRRQGLEPRLTRDSNLIPWKIEPEHRYNWHVMMLRAEARRRDGKKLPAREAAELDSWLAKRKAEDSVVHYDPETEQGFFLVPRRPGIDTDLIRVPEAVTTMRKSHGSGGK